MIEWYCDYEWLRIMSMAMRGDGDGDGDGFRSGKRDGNFGLVNLRGIIALAAISVKVNKHTQVSPTSIV